MDFQQVGDQKIMVQHNGQALFEYVYRPDVSPQESPKPYLHPLKTLGGVTVTDFRPADHRWHHGLAMTVSHLSGMNFWGGHSYVHGQGYVPLANNGRIEHEAWLEQEAHHDAVKLREALHWRTPTGELWLEESRMIVAKVVDEVPNAWELLWMSIFINSSGQALEFGSPTTQGRPQAGYGGLFWRGHPEMLHGEVRTSNGMGEVMGQAAPWLLYQANGVSLLFCDHARNPRYPNQWFVRTSDYPGVCWAFMFDMPYVLPPGEMVGFIYRLVLADGALSDEQIQGLLREW